MRVGALLAAERATMLVVTFVGSAAASLAGGAMMGYVFVTKLFVKEQQ
ncbi:MAG: hypothetical protein HZC40_08205 [Chloroflexi bacterium]|nr:hypothetical protein [Chloroflexota bacterium]